jgi:predicted ester cyclase
MNTADLIALNREYFHDVWELGNAAAIDRFVNPNVVVHGLSEPMQGIAAFKAWYHNFRSAFSNIAVAVSHCTRDGDFTTARILFSGTHTGPSLGPKPSYKPVTFSALCLCRWHNDQIVEAFNEFNHLSLLQQIGAVPAQ